MSKREREREREREAFEKKVMFLLKTWREKPREHTKEAKTDSLALITLNRERKIKVSLSFFFCVSVFLIHSDSLIHSRGFGRCLKKSRVQVAVDLVGATVGQDFLRSRRSGRMGTELGYWGGGLCLVSPWECSGKK